MQPGKMRFLVIVDTLVSVLSETRPILNSFALG